MVEKAARRGDEYVYAAPHLVYLRVYPDAAEDNGGVEAEVLAVGAHAFGDLGREFAGRRKYERPGSAPPCANLLASGKELKHGKREGGRFAGACLRACEYISALKDNGNGLGLNGCGNSVALCLDSTEQFGLEAEQFK